MPKNGDQIKIFGQTYQLQLVCSDKIPLGIFIKDRQIVVNVFKLTANIIQKELETFLKHTATTYIFKRTGQLAKKMKLKYGRITLRQQKTRWGSCSSQHNLNFNWRLVHFPVKIIDYVIIHELAHLKEMNHSTQFWQLVGLYDPAYPQHRGWLKRNQINLE